MTIRRRDVLIFGSIVSAIYGLRALPWQRLTGRGLAYVEIEDVPPFRRLKSEGQTSSASFALIGLDGPSDDAEVRRARMEAMRADPELRELAEDEVARLRAAEVKVCEIVHGRSLAQLPCPGTPQAASRSCPRDSGRSAILIWMSSKPKSV